MVNLLIDRRGQPQLGLITNPVSDVNYLDFDYRTPMDKPLPNWRKKLGFNQFQFIGLMDADFIVGIAVVDLKLVSNLFVYVYDIQRKKLVEKSIIHPGALFTSMATTPDGGRSSFRGPGYQAYIEIDLQQRLRKVDLHIGRDIHVSASLQEGQHYEPLRVCSQAGYGRWVYTQKGAGLPVNGTIRWGDIEHGLKPQTASGSYDWSGGFMRRETSWNWACFSGLLADGRRVGLNLAAGVNETGITENAFWLDGKMIKLDMANFVFDRYQPEKKWRVSTTDSCLELTFTPQGKRQEKLDVIVLASNFKQMFGHFSGTYRHKDGEIIRLIDVPGFMEDHYAKW